MRKTLLSVVLTFPPFFCYSQSMIEVGYARGLGLAEIGQDKPSSNGVFLSYFYDIRHWQSNPLYIGITGGFNNYGSVDQKKAPFFRSGYDYDFADINNSH